MKAATVVIALFICVVGMANAAPRWHQLESTGYDFAAYVAEYGRTYTGEEFALRQQLFEARLASVIAHNKDNSKSWKEGINHLSDRTEAEFKALLGYNKAFGYSDSARKGTPYVFRQASLPKSVDWRDRGVISAVKDQGQCGSCWTFGTAETIESHWALATDNLPVLSEQQILDCTGNPQKCGGTGGCGGGTGEIAMAQIIKQGGLSSEWTYPYESYWGGGMRPCNFSAKYTPPAAKLRSYTNLPANTYEPVMEALAHEGPLIINVDASSWHNYEGGVYDGCNKTNPDIDHVVQLVGYGSDKEHGDYWLVRNSWTPAWGESGYVRIKREEKFSCGTDLNPQDGTGCTGGPATVKVCGECGVLFDVLYPLVDPVTTMVGLYPTIES
eukprot:TRINITY_DN956_c0_g1_i1.p2 TRINITY_DN956_c0_g1~~TRINITY_DN956_c0_g1_i1.p2  ORF type:complete len:385 (+),score=54.65 TRINITY_DN956_c0_g1_i1:45-1199(+)